MRMYSCVGVCGCVCVWVCYHISHCSCLPKTIYLFKWHLLPQAHPVLVKPSNDVRRIICWNSLVFWSVLYLNGTLVAELNWRLGETEYLRCVSLPSTFALSEHGIRKCYGIQLFLVWLFEYCLSAKHDVIAVTKWDKMNRPERFSKMHDVCRNDFHLTCR